VLAGGGLLLLHGTRTILVRGQVPTFPPLCCVEGEYDLFGSYPCDDWAHRCCTDHSAFVNNTTDCIDAGFGILNKYTWWSNCGFFDPNLPYCSPSSECPGYSWTTWEDDPGNCTSPCSHQDEYCESNDWCCEDEGLYCDTGTWTCQPLGGGGGPGCTVYNDGNNEWCYLNGFEWDGPCGEDFYCDTDLCECVGYWPWEDPIIIDLTGHGFVLTTLSDGVLFDFFGTGMPRQTSWTAAGTDVGFLALDRNGNGRIDNGTELFGNITPQPKLGNSRKGNGFLALAEFDKPENGGNSDGWITNADAVYSTLLVWVDKNHNGVSRPGELLGLTRAGIQAISLDFRKSRWADDYGNIFRYRSAIVWYGHSGGAQWIYDVILRLGK